MRYKFSKYLTGFPKNHNTKQTLLKMVKNWKSNINKEIKYELSLWTYGL